jgi:cation diffusion facilitator CzcD-associated flavoprotein CzcO
MSFWEQNMPAGMLLRSPWSATHIADPTNAFTLDAYVAANGNHLPEPIPLDRFIHYGRWFQSQVAPNLDRRKIRRVESAGDGFQVTAEDGETFRAKRVVVATGIAPFANWPAEFVGLPGNLVSHSVTHGNLAPFKGKRVMVIGGGQSALESAALLHEIGADVELVMRRSELRWLKWRAMLLKIKLLGRVLYSPRDVGPAGISQLVARPDLFRLFPRGMQDKMGKRSIKPAGAVWLQPRLTDVKIRTNSVVQAAQPSAGRLRVKLKDGTEQDFDHVLLATGYRIDISKYEFLAPELVNRIERFEGYPRLRTGLESSVPGLFFLGAPAAWSFGPVARFVSGTYYCVGAMARRVAKTL